MRGALFIVLALVLAVSATPLDDYVWAADPTFDWNVTGTHQGTSSTSYIMRVRSQTWLNSSISNRWVWEHDVVVAVPDKLATNVGMMYIDGGSDNDSPPDPNNLDPMFSYLAETSGCISVHLLQIPNEPIIFENDGVRRTEDALIAWTWKTFLNDNNFPYVLARMPMTKAAVWTMTAVEEMVYALPQAIKVDQWIVAGASKRGWTTWTTAAVDKRVVGAVPIVMDVLNMQANLNHHYEAYGGWSFALDDYVNAGVTHWLNTQEMLNMAAIIDPYSYAPRLTMPKLVICATGDEFFLPDDPLYFWNQLPEPKVLRMVPNAEHSMAGHQVDLLLNIQIFLTTVVRQQPLPSFSWTFGSNYSSITVTLNDNNVPRKVLVWRAHNPLARDFRLLTSPDTIQPIFWFESELTPTAPKTYEVDCIIPEEGWAGYFIELEYMIDGLTDPFKLTTEVAIVPNVMPYPPCGIECSCKNNCPSDHVLSAPKHH
jgi:PhoPQ-activated pathogenicity-related protein